MPFAMRCVVISLAGFVLLCCASARGGSAISATTVSVPDPASVETYGTGYRYPQAGWTVLHIEGEPYERGYQHGQLLHAEIVDYIQALAADRSAKAPADAWRDMRLITNALFLRRYDLEYLEEMKGIADGAAAAGAKFDDRAIELLDIVAINSAIEVDFLDSGLEAVPTGLEGRKFAEPPSGRLKPVSPEHCSAFAATGPATADGKVVFGHITMWNLNHVRHFNVWLDIKPAKGHRIAMQTYPGGIMSGMDYYMNDAGLLVTETTIEQTRFDLGGKALCARIRSAMQYADSIDGVVEMLSQSNNGLYSNEWLLADTKTNEIAMFELGTQKQRLWRSSKEEWVAGTTGFYWGCNNTKDLEVRLETVASVSGKPANVLYRPSDRDKKWIALYKKYKGTISSGFGFKAFSTPTLVAFPSCDAKFTTSALAKDLKTWAMFGPPLGKTWEPTLTELHETPKIRPLVINDWTVLSAQSPPKSGAPSAAVDLAHKDKHKETVDTEHDVIPLETLQTTTLPAAWHGTLLPATDADVWLAAGFSDFEKIVALENSLLERAKGSKLGDDEQDLLAVKRFAPRSHYLTAVRRLGKDVPLGQTVADQTQSEWYDIAAGKGTLLLAQLRERIGAKPFDKLLDEFGRAHAGKAVSTEEFIKHMRAATGPKADEFFAAWMRGPLVDQDMGTGCWAIDSFEAEPERALIVYGTVKEKGAQHEAAQRLQRRLARRWSNVSIPIKSDTHVTEDDLSGHHLLLIGRPETNSVVARCAGALPISFGSCSFRVRDKTYAHPGSAVVVAAANPINPRYSLVTFAGLGADATWHIPEHLPDHGGLTTEVFLLAAGSEAKSLIVSQPKPAAGTPQATAAAK